jgi:hypothetical protein
MTDQTTLIEAIDYVEKYSDPTQLFELVAEDIVLSNAELILQDQENSYRTVILLLAIEKNFSKLHNRGRVADIVLQSMSLFTDTLIYEKVQRIILNHVRNWQKHETRKFHQKFKNDYQDNYGGGDTFVAELAIEGAILLPIFLHDKFKLASTIDMLRDEFPQTSQRHRSSVYLTTKILKLLRYSYHLLNDSEEIVEIFKDNLNSISDAVKAEANFALGITELYKAFKAENNQTLQQALSNANEWFESTKLLQTNRTDAELFLQISKLYLWLLYSATIDRVEVISIIRQIQDIVIERFLLNQIRYSYTEWLEFKLINFVNTLEQWIILIEDAKKWPDIKPPMKLLSDIFAFFDNYSLDQDLADKAIRSGIEWIALPRLRTRFLEIQEIEAKLANILSDTTWLQTATETEIEFYKYIIQEIRVSPPKAQAAAQWDRLQAAANQFDFTGELYKNIMEMKSHIDADPIDVMLQIMTSLQQKWQLYSIPINKQIRDISRELLVQLEAKLNWKTVETEWLMLKYVTNLIVKYFYELSIADNHVDYNFLYAKDKGGLGQDAKEGDLQKHFYSTVKLNSDIILEYEPKNVAVGRPDLLVRCVEDIRFPIEVKCEAYNISHDNIRNKYLAQAQEYAADSNQVGF